LARAQAAVALLSRSLQMAHPESNRGLVIRLVPIRRHLVGEFWTPLLVLVGAVAFVLLTACANVANLLLSRAARRQRETAIRQALGASRRALVRESVAEACLLSLAGATLSIPVAWSLTRLLRAFGPDEIWQFPAISTNWRVLASCAGLAVVTGLAIGLLSGFWGSRTAPEVFLRAGGTGSRQPFARRGLGSAFLIAEVALAFPLMIGSGLMIQSLWRLGHANLGFRTDGLSVAQIWLLRYRYPEERERREFFGRVLDGVRRTPGVEAVGLISNEPVGPFGLENRPYRIDGKETPVEESPEASFKVVDPGYLDTLGVPLLRGRPLSVLDDDRAPPVALVSASLGSRLALADPIGSMIQVRFPKRWETVRIVGVVGDVASWPEARSGPTIYMSYRQRVVPPISLVFRSRLTRMGADRAIREVVRAVDPDQLVRRVEPMSELLDRALTTSRFVAFLLETFAALALALAAVGTYSVTSYLVAQRRAEIGIRTALGACRRDVLSLFVGQSLRRAAVGVLLGLVAALVLTRFLERLLFDVTSMDTPTLLGGVAVLLSAGALGAYFPARAAARLDPVTALRAE
jgi:putative ABC transport system permease protein